MPHCVHDPRVSASGEDDESFVFHGRYHGLLSLEIIYLKFFIAQDQQRWACLFVFSGPVYGAGKVPPQGLLPLAS